MKHGPLVLITQNESILNEKLIGTMAPDGLNRNLLSTLRSVVIDDQLDKDASKDVEEKCLVNRVPFFYWKTPDYFAELDKETFLETLETFLEEQNEWRIHAPSPETLERIELQAMVDIITTANSLLQPDEVMHTVMTRIHQLIPCGAWSVLILEDRDSDPILTFAAAFGPGKEQLEHLKVPFGQGIAGWVAKHRQPIIVNNAQNDPRFLDQIDKNTQFVTKNILCAPLVSRGRTIGVIEMLNREDQEGFTEGDLELLQTLVNPAAVAIENAYLFQKAQTLTIQDDLTKLYNSRHLNHCLEAELKRAQRTGNNLSLLFLDLDGFKGVNDNYGHLQGSQCLIEVAEIIKRCARDTDIVGRYGGDEFVLILPSTDTDGAKIVAERIRDSIEAYRPKGICMTASIGLASYPAHGKTKEGLFRLADQAMYRVKEKGKNGILIADQL